MSSTNNNAQKYIIEGIKQLHNIYIYIYIYLCVLRERERREQRTQFKIATLLISQTNENSHTTINT